MFVLEKKTIALYNMFLNTLTVALSIAATVTSFPTTTTRRTNGNIDLYAYGKDISGLQLWGGSDGEDLCWGSGT